MVTLTKPALPMDSICTSGACTAVFSSGVYTAVFSSRASCRLGSNHALEQRNNNGTTTSYHATTQPRLLSRVIDSSVANLSSYHGPRDSIGQRAVHRGGVVWVELFRLGVPHAVYHLEASAGFEQNPRLHVASQLGLDQVDDVVRDHEVDRPFRDLRGVVLAAPRASGELRPFRGTPCEEKACVCVCVCV